MGFWIVVLADKTAPRPECGISAPIGTMVLDPGEGVGEGVPSHFEDYNP